jgi:DNA-directed RNA polymerase subunit RPC12/RpoP
MENVSIANSISAVTVAYNCPNCGAELMFNADKQKLCCEFCESEFTNAEIESTNAREVAEQKQQAADSFCTQMNDYSCPNCGAEIVADETTASDICVYCHSPIVLRGKLSGQMMPDRIIPFKYGKDEAVNKFFDFVRKKWFVPKAFKSRKQIEYISGVYFPFWVTDADTIGEYNAKAVKIRSWRSGDTQYTETSNYRIYRRGHIHFEDIVTSALAEGDKEMLEGILPFPSDSLQPFDMSYLSGFLAKKRSIEREQLSGEVKNRMNDYATRLLSGTVHGYTRVNTTSRSLYITHSNWEYSLMPIWMLNYVTPKKTYKYAMNGYTGKIYGELPISIKRLLVACGVVFAAVAPIVGVIGGFI